MPLYNARNLLKILGLILIIVLFVAGYTFVREQKEVILETDPVATSTSSSKLDVPVETIVSETSTMPDVVSAGVTPVAPTVENEPQSETSSMPNVDSTDVTSVSPSVVNEPKVEDTNNEPAKEVKIQNEPDTPSVSTDPTLYPTAQWISGEYRSLADGIDTKLLYAPFLYPPNWLPSPTLAALDSLHTVVIEGFVGFMNETVEIERDWASISIVTLRIRKSSSTTLEEEAKNTASENIVLPDGRAALRTLQTKENEETLGLIIATNKLETQHVIKYIDSLSFFSKDGDYFIETSLTMREPQGPPPGNLTDETKKYYRNVFAELSQSIAPAKRVMPTVESVALEDCAMVPPIVRFEYGSEVVFKNNDSVTRSLWSYLYAVTTFEAQDKLLVLNLTISPGNERSYFVTMPPNQNMSILRSANYAVSCDKKNTISKPFWSSAIL